MRPAICWRLPPILLLSFSPLYFLSQSVPFSSLQDFFSQLTVSAKASWLWLKKISSFQALLISALISSSALCQILCVFIEVTFFSSSKSIAVGRRSSGNVQVIFLTTPGCLLHAHTLCLYAPSLSERLYSKGRGEVIGLKSRCVIFCLRKECKASGYVA